MWRTSLLSLALLIPVPLASQVALRVNPSPALAEMREALARGEVSEVSRLQKGALIDLRVRLISVSEEGTCVEDTDVICSHRYYLTTSEYAQESQAVGLGEVGEIGKVEWVRKSADGVVTFRLHVTSLPASAARLVPARKVTRALYELDASTHTVRLRRVS